MLAVNPCTLADLGHPQSVCGNMINEWKLPRWKAVNSFLSWNLFQNHFTASGKTLAKHSSCGDSKI